MEKFNNIYIGICVANNDPEMRGRVQVYVPQIAPNISKLNENVDKFFKFLGKESGSDLSNVLTELKDVLPWAEYAGPLFGGNASGRYNATLDSGTTSDSNAWVDDKVAQTFRPANNYISDNTIPDAFSKTGEHKNKFTNPDAFQYTPSNYSNLARGMFSIPNVGAHLYIFFIDGDKNFPVYFASAYGEEDIKRVFTLSNDVEVNSSIDYPASYENIKKSKLDSDSKTFRSKSFVNSNKHTIEMIDTDLKEILKFTHYSGSFKEFNNNANIELATNNDQKLVLGDQFLTVNRNKSEYIKAHNEKIIGGDRYLTVGESKKSTVESIVALHREIHEIKYLFDIQRAETGETPNNVSSLQKRVKSPLSLTPKGFKVCPVCGNKPYDPYKPAWRETDPVFNKEPMLMWQEAPKYLGGCLKFPMQMSENTGGTAESGNLEAAGQKVGFDLSCHSWKNDLIKEPECPAYMANLYHPFTGKLGYFMGMKCPCCNGVVQSLGGIGYSPSTEDGMFMPEPLKFNNSGATPSPLDLKIIQLLPEITKLEKELGIGGDEIVNISMSKIETIGLVMNDLPSFRIDPIGKMKTNGCWVSPQATFQNYLPSPHVEYVDVADIPGGDYILTVMNKYKLMVGSRGINIQTTGPIDIYGTIVNLTGEQLNISSKSEIIIDGGERLSLRSKKLTLLPVEHNAVMIEGQLHVTRNTIIQGGMMLEGEVALLHVTAPLEWQETENGMYQLEPMCQIPCIYNIESSMISLPNHTHYFKNLPLSLLPHGEAVRHNMIQKGINSRENIAAADVVKNIANCEGNVFNTVSEAFLKVAKQKADAAYTSNDGGASKGIYQLGSAKCQPSGENSTIITATYGWKFDGHSGTVMVTGTVTDGKLVSGPK